MQPGTGEPVEVLGTADGHDGSAPVVGGVVTVGRWPALALASATLVLAGWLIGGSGTPAPPAPPPPTSTPAAWAPSGDLLVAAVPGGVLAVDTTDGAATVLPTPGSPQAVAAASPGSVFVHYRDGEVELVDLVSGGVEPFATGVTWFAPSSASGRVWLRYGARPDAIIEIDSTRAVHARVDRSDLPAGDPRFGDDGSDRLTAYTDDGTLALGRRRLVATTPATIYAAVCDQGRCRLQRRSAQGDDRWRAVVAEPMETQQVAVSGDDSWLLSMGSHLAVYAVDRVGVTLVHTGARDALFSPDSSHLYVLTGNELEVLDLDGSGYRAVALSALARTGADWEVVAVPAP